MKFTSSILSFIIFLIAILFSIPKQTKAQQTGFIAAYGTISIPKSNKTTLDSIQWSVQNILVPKYQGKKIKRILLQLSTAKVVLFLGGDDLVEMDKNEAIKEGYISDSKPAATVLKKVTPKIIVDSTKIVTVDSPLYVGITNHIKFKSLPNKKLYVVEWQSPYFKVDSANKEININITTPGLISLFLHSQKTGQCAYEYVYKVKRLPQDELKEEPIITVGNLSGEIVDAATFKRQTTLNISKGFTFKSAYIYFSGQPFLNVYIAHIDTVSLETARLFINQCLPGSNILFDNIQVVDNLTEKVYTINRISYKLIDAAAIDRGENPDSNKVVYPSVIEGNDSMYIYLQKNLAQYKYEDVENEYNAESVEFKVMANGSIQEIPDISFQPRNSLERKFLDLIENGPKWKPATYNGENIDILFSYEINFDVEN
jgi:hypothetical protein